MADSLSHRKTAKLSGKPRHPCAYGALGRALGAHISVAVRSNQGELGPQQTSAARHTQGRAVCVGLKGAQGQARGSAAEMKAQADLELMGGKVVPQGGCL